MILKRMDETILSGQYEAEGNDAEKTVLLVEPEIIKQDNIAPGQSPALILKWKKVEEGTVSKSLLYYDDTIDTSHKKYLPAWEKFYKLRNVINVDPPYAGGDCIYRGGAPRGSEITKSSTYLRYSDGFIKWVKQFDIAASERLEEETELFGHVKKLEGWSSSSEEFWILPILAKLSSGKYVVLGLQPNLDISSNLCSDLKDINIDVEKSLQIMKLLRKPERNTVEKIVPELQMRSGLGHNPFGWGDDAKDLQNIPSTEKIRLYGIIPESSIQEIKGCWKNHNLIEYRHIRFSPNPSQSSLLFLPEGDYKYEELEDDIRKENVRYENFSKQKKRKSITNDDKEGIVSQRPSPLPMNCFATVYMVNLEGNNQKKLIVQQIIPSVLMRYFAALNEEIMRSDLQNRIADYMNTALNSPGNRTPTPATYTCWTNVFTKALQKRFFSVRPIYDNFQKYASHLRSDALLECKSADLYFGLVGKMLRLAHLISVAKDNSHQLGTQELAKELDKIESFLTISKQGVFGTMTTVKIPSGEEILGETYNSLRDYEKQKFDSFVRKAFAGVPGEDFKTFCRGALTGILLQKLDWCVNKKAGRKFTVTQGRHPTGLRGTDITNLFAFGIGLLANSAQTEWHKFFNTQILPFIKSVEAESFKNAFNSGMIMGMAYFEPRESSDDKAEGQNEK